MNFKLQNQNLIYTGKAAKSLCFLVFGMLILFSIQASAQSKDSLKLSKPKADSILFHSPKKAAIFSAILPGLGQAYNRKYWKIPILYGGFAGLGYIAIFNNKGYNKYKEALYIRSDGKEETIDPYVEQYSDENLSLLVDIYRRDRDLTMFGLFALYMLNVIDATVDAHLFNFDVGDKLSINWTPQMYYEPMSGKNISGFAICMSIL